MFRSKALTLNLGHPSGDDGGISTWVNRLAVLTQALVTIGQLALRGLDAGSVGGGSSTSQGEGLARLLDVLGAKRLRIHSSNFGTMASSRTKTTPG